MRNLAALDLAGNPPDDSGAPVPADSPDAAGLADLGLCATGTGNGQDGVAAGGVECQGVGVPRPGAATPVSLKPETGSRVRRGSPAWTACPAPVGPEGA